MLEQLHARAKTKQSVIAFPDALDVRTLHAVVELSAEGLCVPCLVGDRREIHLLGQEHQLDVSSIEIHDVSELSETVALGLMKKRARKGITEQEARELSLDALNTAGYLLSDGLVQGVVAGSLSTTPNVLRAGIINVGLAPSSNTVSSFFLMLLQNGDVYTYSDCGVVPNPTSEQLADIAFSAAESHKLLTGDEPRVAFLSFSTKGSAEHSDVDKVRVAYELFRSYHPQVLCDGELQFDAATVPEIANRKAPGSALKGNANVFVFPNLDAGNIAYKITERLAGATALGPIIQGLAKPYCDLSRGCSVTDIINVAVITSVLSESSVL